VAKTQYFGLNKFGADGRLSDEGYKFTLRDRDLIDTILYTLMTHNHATSAISAIEGPPAGIYLDLTVSASGGTIPAGRDYYYKFSYQDAQGNETQASSAILISTPDPISAPDTQNLSTASTGGTLEPGTYKYALAFYQDAGGVTTAPNVSTITVPLGTSTNTVTVPLPTLPADADGWRIYRRGPGDLEYWLLDTENTGTEYVDDGSVSPDCTQKRPVSNTTNSTNSIVIDLPASELPLDTRITAWNIYRSSNPGAYPANSLVATVVETTTEGGADLVTTYTDVGGALNQGLPLGQTSVPDPPPQIDASQAFDELAGRLPAAIAPQGVHTLGVFMPGTLAQQTYHQFVPPYDMPGERIDAFFSTAPTGLTPSTDYITVRFSDDASQNEIQALYNDAVTYDEIQTIYNDATAGTFTLGDGIDTTSSIDFDAAATVIETRLETDIASITDVTVTGSGIITDPWVITYVDPAATNVTQLTPTDSLTGGSTTVTTVREGNDGGTFTLSDGTDTTSAIAFDASAATITTRLETDITSITDVTVTGTGTFADPWLIEFVDPGGQDLDLLIVDDGSPNLNGNSFISEYQEGYGSTQIDLIIDQNQQDHNWQSPTTDYGTQEAEEAPATGDGVTVSDNLALNDSAVELDAQNEEHYWNVGTLDPGTYVARFWVSDVDTTASFDIEVIDDHLGTPATMATYSLSPGRTVYTPAYELKFTSTGTEDVFLVVTKTDTGADAVRVDKWEYEVLHPTLHAGSTVTCEVIVTGTPTTNGDDLNVTFWY
jgi:hypothetical protein